MRKPAHTRQRAVGADAVSALLAQLYCANAVHVCSAQLRPEVDHERWELGTARVDIVRHRGMFTCTAQPVAKLVVTRMVSGTMTVRSGGRDIRVGCGETLLLAQPGHELRVDVGYAQMQHVSVDVAAVQRAAGARVPTDHLLDRLRYGILHTDSALRWQRTVRYVTDAVLADPVARSSSLITQAAVNLLACTLVSAFLPELAVTPVPDASPQRASVDAARAFIETNADVALTVADIARSVALTPRALQMGFRRHLDTTPMAHLRAVRLERLRADLGDADPLGDATVTDLAARWGLTGTAYTQAYRRTYGELPRTTLRS